MIRADFIYLIKEGTHGVFEDPSVHEIKRGVFCEVRSVGANEYYRALEHGLEPQFVFTIADYTEYDGEKTIEYNGQRWRVVRVYYDDNAVELTVEEAVHNVR